MAVQPPNFSQLHSVSLSRSLTFSLSSSLAQFHFDEE